MRSGTLNISHDQVENTIASRRRLSSLESGATSMLAHFRALFPGSRQLHSPLSYTCAGTLRISAFGTGSPRKL
jgi:hypothetical protein